MQRMIYKILVGYTRNIVSGKVDNYHRIDVANTLTASTGGGAIRINLFWKFMKRVICAMRGRGYPPVQTIEINRGLVSNTLTTTTKDNLVIEYDKREDKNADTEKTANIISCNKY